MPASFRNRHPKTERAAFAARSVFTSTFSFSLCSSLPLPSSLPSSLLPSSLLPINMDFNAHPTRNEAHIASLSAKCGG
jgi:hypothetical protein